MTEQAEGLLRQAMEITDQAGLARLYFAGADVVARSIEAEASGIVHGTTPDGLSFAFKGDALVGFIELLA